MNEPGLCRYVASKCGGVGTFADADRSHCKAGRQAQPEIADRMPLAGASCHHAPKDDAMKVDAALRGWDGVASISVAE